MPGQQVRLMRGTRPLADRQPCGAQRFGGRASVGEPTRLDRLRAKIVCVTISDFELQQPPLEDQRALEIWLAHVAGFILTEAVANAAMRHLTESGEVRTDRDRDVAARASEHTLLELFELLDGIPPYLRGTDGEGRDVSAHIEASVIIERDGEEVAVLDLGDTDGLGGWYHGDWALGRFGDPPAVRPRDR